MNIPDDYSNVRQLPDGRYVGIKPMMYTTGLFVGLDELGYAGRYCYEFEHDARSAVETWDGQGDPPGPWIKAKGFPEGERLGPGATEEG